MEADLSRPVRVEDGLDWKHPDYRPIYRERLARIARLRTDPDLLIAAKVYYKAHIADFINDWGVTYDQRVISDATRSAMMPLVLMPKQREWVDWFVDHWRNNKPGLTEKSRDCGISWLAMAASASLCLFFDDMSIGFGSQKEDKVDRTGDPDTLFYKGRIFTQNLPREFKGGWDVKKHSAHMRIAFPDTGSSITGEAGDNIGRGGRKSIYVVDESAHTEHPKLIAASLSATTDCRIDVSSVNGMANDFAERRHSGNIDVFVFDWRDDPRKDPAWYERKCKEINDPVIVAAEIDRNYTASTEGVIIPQEWVQAAIDAHVKLGIKPSGIRRGAFDVADLGRDANAFATRYGVLLDSCEAWKGQTTGDVYASTEYAYLLADQYGLDEFDYDADGLGGASVRPASTRIDVRRVEQKQRRIRVGVFRGSGEVMFPEQKMPGTDRKNIDYFQNFKAQSWWYLRTRFYTTWRAVVKGETDYDRDAIISIASGIKDRSKLTSELSQPIWKLSLTGKVMVDKTPDGVASPNLGDAVMMVYAPRREPIRIDPSTLAAFGVHGE